MPLANTQLETHPLGSSNANGIINGNWGILDTIFDPAITTGLTYGALQKGLGQGVAMTTLTPGASVAINLRTRWQSLTPGQNTTFTFSNLQPGTEVYLRLIGDGSVRTLTWPAGTIFCQTATSLAANKTAIVHLRSFGTAAADVIGTFFVQP